MMDERSEKLSRCIATHLTQCPDRLSDEVDLLALSDEVNQRRDGARVLASAQQPRRPPAHLRIAVMESHNESFDAVL